jgi:UDP-N-acetylmuramoylalanine--D-glutamate ligase
MGLGHFGGGSAAARWLAAQGALVTVTDQADEHALADSLSRLAGRPIRAVHLGGHREEDFRGADLVVVNPAVRPGNPFVELAARSGARITTEIELFMEACPGRMIGVTGSNGKSTTAAMTAAILRADGRRTWLGGNLGGSLLEDLPEIRSGDWIVLELSSFQLWRLGDNAPVPEVAIVTNCTPNHLDWHPDPAHYAAAKQRILTRQRPGGLSVMNALDPEVATWKPLVRGHLLPPLEPDDVPPLRVPGSHNRIDAACAGAAARGVGCPAEAIHRGLGAFGGLPQRLERIAVLGGRRFYNDSSATTPESTIQALNALDEPIWLLAGGSDKGADFKPLARAIVARARGAAFFGAVGPRLRASVGELAPCFPAESVTVLSDALNACWRASRPGGAILLSPGCASRDQFINYRQRGELFMELVRQLRPNRE